MLVLRALRKSYGSFQALHGLDLEVRAGEVLALLGRNGAGKSTTVKCIVGLHEADGGSITVDGVDLAKDPLGARRKIGYLPEVARLHDPLTPVEFLLLKGRLFGMADAAILAAAERLLGGFELWERRDSPMAGFSKGMLQKVSLAGALLCAPRLLILDEPLSGLDVHSALVIKEVMAEFARRGGAVLHCSHLLDVVETTADRVALLDQGRLLAVGTLAELRAQAGAASDARLDDVFRTLTRTADPAAAARAILG